MRKIEILILNSSFSFRNLCFWPSIFDKSATIERLHDELKNPTLQRKTTPLHSVSKLFFFILDEKKQYDPTGFRDAILEGLEAAGSDLDSVSKFLDVSGSKLDYRRYGVNLIEILIAGGLLGNNLAFIYELTARWPWSLVCFDFTISTYVFSLWFYIFIKISH